VVGPLATHHEPHSYDLCEGHAVRMSAPRGWEMVRHEGEFMPAPPNPDDLEAIADAVRESGRTLPSARAGSDSAPEQEITGGKAASQEALGGGDPSEGTAGRRGSKRHLRSVPAARAE